MNINFTNYFKYSFMQRNLIFQYFVINELLWQEGFYFDFLQKKITDKWIKKFLIAGSVLFNDKLIFETITKFFILQILMPLKKLSGFDINSVSNTLTITIFFFLIIFIFYLYIYIYLLVF